jgi:type 1 glutamine amidotransferase
LDHYDAVLIHFKDYPEHLWLPKDAHFNPVDYVKKRDKGLVVAHFGCGAFEGMAHFSNLIGRAWNPKFRGHDPYGNYQVNIIDKDHPITDSMDDCFRTDGELYTCLDGDTPIRVLCEAKSKVDKKDYPIGFVVPHPAGRVFHCTIGHDVNALQSEGSRELYQRALAWAAGLPPER